MSKERKVELLGLKEISELVGWPVNKGSVYYNRGKMPEPFALVGGRRPVWLKEVAEEWARGVKNEEEVDGSEGKS